MTGAVIDVPIDAYRQRAANAAQPRSHKADAARLLNPKTLNVHDRDMAEWLSDTAVNYFADVSEYQPLFDSSFAYPIRMFRCHSGYRVDAHAAANWADTGKSLANGKTRISFTYPVFVPGQFATVKRDFINLFGNQTPTNRLVPVIDMESGPGFAGPGNHSTEANDWAAWFADYSGTPIDMVRSHGYANKPDFAACWPSILPVIPKHTAAYNAINPGGFAWQYQGGNPAYPVPAGAPRSYAPFGTYVDGNVIYLPIDAIERALGITPTITKPEDDMILILEVDPTSVPADQKSVSQGTFTNENILHWIYDGESFGNLANSVGIIKQADNATIQAYAANATVAVVTWGEIRRRAMEKAGPGGQMLLPTGTDFGAGTGIPNGDGTSWVPMPGIAPTGGGTVVNNFTGPTTADITAAMGAALTNGTPRPALPTSSSTQGEQS